MDRWAVLFRTAANKLSKDKKRVEKHQSKRRIVTQQRRDRHSSEPASRQVVPLQGKFCNDRLFCKDEQDYVFCSGRVCLTTRPDTDSLQAVEPNRNTRIKALFPNRLKDSHKVSSELYCMYVLSPCKKLVSYITFTLFFVIVCISQFHACGETVLLVSR